MTATAAYWPPLAAMFQCAHEVVDLLENPEQRLAAEVKARDARWVRDFAKRLKPPVGETIRHWGTQFVTITQSDWPGALPGLLKWTCDWLHPKITDEATFRQEVRTVCKLDHQAEALQAQGQGGRL